MALDRRTLVHGILALPAAPLLARRPPDVVPAAAVHNGAELAAALKAAAPGGTIVLEPGDYGDVGLFELAAPDVTLRARVPLGAVLRAPLLVAGDRARLLPLLVVGDRARLLDLACHGEGAGGIHMSALASTSGAMMQIRSADVEVAGVDFGFFGGRAILVRPRGLRPYIHDCTFHDSRDGGGDKNAHEAVALGYDNPTSGTSMRARVVDNRFWNLNVASENEAICVKTSDNLVQGNRIEGSRTGFSNRYGERNTFLGNMTVNSRGFAVEDRGNKLVGNTVSGGGSIRILAGNVAADTTTNGPHIQATGTYLEGNEGTLVVGSVYSGLSPVLPAIV